jgi:multiple sugar transport system substrate-binding protein
VHEKSLNIALSRRRLLQIAAGSAGAAALAACAAPAASPTASPGSTTPAPATPGASPVATPDKPFAGRSISVIAHSGHDLYLPTTVIPAFEAATGATVEYVPIPAGDLNTRWTTMAAARDGSIDVLYGNAAHAATFSGSGIYEDLTNLADPAIVSGMNDATRQASQWAGKIWYLAMDSVAWIFLWNTEMYEAADLDPATPPQTFDDYIEWSKKLTVGDRYATHLPMNWFTYLLMYNSTGSTVLSEDNRTLNADTADARLVLDAMKRLVDSRMITPASYSPDVTFDAGEGFRTEQIAHYIGASSHYPRTQNPDLATTIGKVRTGLVPGLKLRSGTTTGNEGFGVNAFSQNKDVALAFAEFLHTDEMQKYVALQWGRGPGQKKFVDDPSLLDPDLATSQPHIATLLEQVKYPARRYQAPFHFDLDRVFTEHIQRMVTGQQSVDETARTTQRLGQEIVDAYWASVS